MSSTEGLLIGDGERHEVRSVDRIPDIDIDANITFLRSELLEWLAKYLFATSPSFIFYWREII